MRGTNFSNDGIRINDQVFIKGMYGHLGRATVEGLIRIEDELRSGRFQDKILIRLYISDIDERGEKYLTKNSRCLITQSASLSRLYAIDEKELIRQQPVIKRTQQRVKSRSMER